MHAGDGDDEHEDGTEGPRPVALAVGVAGTPQCLVAVVGLALVPVEGALSVEFAHFPVVLDSKGSALASVAFGVQRIAHIAVSNVQTALIGPGSAGTALGVGGGSSLEQQVSADTVADRHSAEMRDGHLNLVEPHHFCPIQPLSLQWWKMTRSNS